MSSVSLILYIVLFITLICDTLTNESVSGRELNRINYSHQADVSSTNDEKDATGESSGMVSRSQSTNVSDKQLQSKILEMQRVKCVESMQSDKSSERPPRTQTSNATVRYCESIWDGALCWNDTEGGTIATKKCPIYVHGFNHSGWATRFCTVNGTWQTGEDGKGWSNYTGCTLSLPIDMPTHFIDHYENIKTIARTGYSVSLVTLVIAFAILRFNKRLRCPRNNLHLHLFTSFIIRSSVFLLKPLFVAVPHEEVLSITSSVTVNSFASIPLANVTGDTGESNYLVNVTGNYVSNYRSDVLSAAQSLSSNSPFISNVLSQIHSLNSTSVLNNSMDTSLISFYFDSLSSDGGSSSPLNLTVTSSSSMSLKSISCKIFTMIWQYSLVANYNWILIEGMYLHNLVFMYIFNDNTQITKYVIAGWGLPVLIIIPWSIAKSMYDNELCWESNLNTWQFWIIRGPVTFSIILNWLFFVNITRVLFSKMFSRSSTSGSSVMGGGEQNSRRTVTGASSAPGNTCAYNYSKWFKSTLVLVPLFGVHYFFFLIFRTYTEFSNKSIIEVIWLYVDMTFSSFQGFFVALLYCFLNGEVQQELLKLWRVIVVSDTDHSQYNAHSMTFHSIVGHTATSMGTKGPPESIGCRSKSIRTRNDTSNGERGVTSPTSATFVRQGTSFESLDATFSNSKV